MNANDIAVLGGGLIGRLLAWRLSGAGARVALYDPGGPSGEGSAAWVAAAMLAPLAEAAVADPFVVGMGAASLAVWPEIVASLPEPVFFQRNGTLVVWHAADRAEAPAFEARVRANAPGGGLDGMAIRQLAGAEVEAAEPALARRFGRALLFAGEGQLDNRQVLSALAAALVKRRVALHWHTPGEAATADARLVIDCRGMGARPQWRALRGVRGEVARVHAPGIGLQRPLRLLHPRYPLYIAPKQNDLYVIGATEIEGEDRSPMSVRSALELLSAAYSVHPGFGEARIIELSTQVRPALPDHRPAVAWDGANIVRVNGLYRHGFLLAPEVSRHAAALVLALLAGQIRDGAAFDAWREAAQCPTLFSRSGASLPA
jgi:glycine oxidase